MTAQAQHTEGRPFTVPALAQRWECSEGLIRKMIERGELRSFRIGVLIRIAADEVERVECQAIPSNDCEADTPLSGMKEGSGDEAGSTPKIGRARKPRLAAVGNPATIHRGPWPG